MTYSFYRKSHLEVDSKYTLMFPGFIFRIKLCRNPFHIIFVKFLPVILIQYCIICSCSIKVQGEKLNNISICILAYLSILDSLKKDLPEIGRLTFVDYFFFTLLISSLLQCISLEWLEWLDIFGDGNVIYIIIQVFMHLILIISILVIIYKSFQIRSIIYQDKPT